MTNLTTHIRDKRELDAAMLNLTQVSKELERSYAGLARRAKAVEDELGRTNATLKSKVAELDAVNAHLEAILGSLPSGVIVRDGEDRIVKVNGAAREILGYESDEPLLGQIEIPELAGPLGVAQQREILTRDGRRRVVSSRLSKVAPHGVAPQGVGPHGPESDDRTHSGSVEILDDRTEIARMNRKVHQLDKMAALGTMAGGIAHELRNPMNAVLGFASLLKRSMVGDEKHARWAERICEGVFEADAIIKSLLTFADPERLHPETVRAKSLLDEVRGIVERDLGPELAKVDLRFETDVDELVADRVMLRQALRNLTANAVQAQPDGGWVLVELRQVDGEIRIQVTDDGPGIPTELAQRVTDPFYTTRPDGTGLGLPLVHTVAELHGGSLEIVTDPAPTHGARIILSFPQDPR